MVSFGRAVRFCCGAGYVRFGGRAARSEYWWFKLFCALLLAAAVLLERGLFLIFPEILAAIGFPNIDDLGVLSIAVWLGVLLPYLAVMVRRLHDVGLGGYWLAVFWLAFPAVYVFASMDSPLTWGFIALAIGSGALVLVAPLWPGTRGPNRFGADPLAPATDR
ncbi:MAG: DUF805 domain-containing protein [Cellvibrionales bacterium]|nr:DUF805 domain-containing protein [Cellvibrionales bacterium]